MVWNPNSLFQTIQRPYFFILLSAFFVVLSLPPFSISFLYWLGLSLFILVMAYNFINHHRYYFFFFFIIQFLSLSWIIQSFASGGWGYLILGILLIILLASFIAFLNYLFIKLTLIFYHHTVYPNWQMIHAETTTRIWCNIFHMVL